jgi:hypothetical protein
MKAGDVSMSFTAFIIRVTFSTIGWRLFSFPRRSYTDSS